MDQLSGVGFVSSSGISDEEETCKKIREIFELQARMSQEVAEMKNRIAVSEQQHAKDQKTIRDQTTKIDELEQKQLLTNLNQLELAVKIDRNPPEIESELSRKERQQLVLIKIDEFYDKVCEKVMSDPELSANEQTQRLNQLDELRAGAKERRETKMRVISAGVGMAAGLGAAGAVTGAVTMKLAVAGCFGAAAVAGIGIGTCIGTVVIGGIIFAAIAYGGYRLYVKLHEGDKKSK